MKPLFLSTLFVFGYRYPREWNKYPGFLDYTAYKLMQRASIYHDNMQVIGFAPVCPAPRV